MDPVQPYLEVTEEPKPKEHRFRYPCEGRTAGALVGVNTSAQKKTCPEVKVHNLNTNAKIVGSLVTKDGNYPHPFRLVGADCKDGIVTKIVSAKHPKARFESMGIQCVKKCDLQNALVIRKDLNVDPYKNINEIMKEDLHDLDCRVVKICFETYLEEPNSPGTFLYKLPPIMTGCIYNKKDTSLKIMKMNREEGTVKGGDEIYMFCDKVDKDDIQVEFTNGNWKDYGQFGPADVHHQIAIVFKTPKFQTTQIETEIDVKITLKRPSDGDLSEPRSFTYFPINEDEDGIECKRKKKCPNFEESFDVEGVPRGTRTPTRNEMVKKKLHDTIMRRRRQSSASTTPDLSSSQGQSSSFNFPAASTDGSIIKSETTISHVTVTPPIDRSFSTIIPKGYFCDFQPMAETEPAGHLASTFSSEGGEILDFHLSDLRVDDDGAFTLEESQLKEFLLNVTQNSHDPLLSQTNQYRDTDTSDLDLIPPNLQGQQGAVGPLDPATMEPLPLELILEQGDGEDIHNMET